MISVNCIWAGKNPNTSVCFFLLLKCIILKKNCQYFMNEPFSVQCRTTLRPYARRDLYHATPAKCETGPWDLHLRQVRDTGILGIDSKPGPEDHSYENNHFIYSVKGLRRTAYVCTFAFAWAARGLCNICDVTKSTAPPCCPVLQTSGPEDQQVFYPRFSQESLYSN